MRRGADDSMHILVDGEDMGPAACGVAKVTAGGRVPPSPSPTPPLWCHPVTSPHDITPYHPRGVTLWCCSLVSSPVTSPLCHLLTSPPWCHRAMSLSDVIPVASPSPPVDTPITSSPRRRPLLRHITSPRDVTPTARPMMSAVMADISRVTSLIAAATSRDPIVTSQGSCVMSRSSFVMS